jgi:glycine/D-amino acid oxidase-like deaminating enzyme
MRLSYRRYQALVGARYGVRWIRNYELSHHPFEEDGLMGLRSPLREMMPELRDLGEGEHPFGATGFPHVRQVDTLLVETPAYLRQLVEDFRRAGGGIVVGELADRAAIARLPERLVWNCSGLGARRLVGDTELVPVKGQLTVLLPQPEVDYTVIPGDLYMFPRSDGILLGGTHQHGVETLTPDPEARRRILDGHRRFFEAMRAP